MSTNAEIIAAAMRQVLQGEPGPVYGSAAHTELMGALHRAASGADFNQIGIHAVGLMLEHTMAGIAVERSVLQAVLGKSGAS